jgi:hypothetical protein
MKCSKRSFAFVSVLFAFLLSFNTGILNARDADPDSLTLVAAHSANQKCINRCRARYRDCLSLKQIPSLECRGIYQDCTRNACSAGAAGRPTWSGFPR